MIFCCVHIIYIYIEKLNEPGVIDIANNANMEPFSELIEEAFFHMRLRINDFEQQENEMLALREVFNKDLPFAVKPGIAVWRLIPTTSSYRKNNFSSRLLIC